MMAVGLQCGCSIELTQQLKDIKFGRLSQVEQNMSSKHTGDRCHKEASKLTSLPESKAEYTIYDKM